MMKYNLSYIAIILVTSLLFFTACSDKYMEDMNTDPSKADSVDPNAQLTTAQLQTYGDLGLWLRSIATIFTHSINI